MGNKLEQVKISAPADIAPKIRRQYIEAILAVDSPEEAEALNIGEITGLDRGTIGAMQTIDGIYSLAKLSADPKVLNLRMPYSEVCRDLNPSNPERVKGFQKWLDNFIGYRPNPGLPQAQKGIIEYINHFLQGSRDPSLITDLLYTLKLRLALAIQPEKMKAVKKALDYLFPDDKKRTLARLLSWHKSDQGQNLLSLENPNPLYARRMQEPGFQRFHEVDKFHFPGDHGIEIAPRQDVCKLSRLGLIRESFHRIENRPFRAREKILSLEILAGSRRLLGFSDLNADIVNLTFAPKINSKPITLDELINGGAPIALTLPILWFAMISAHLAHYDATAHMDIKPSNIQTYFVDGPDKAKQYQVVELFDWKVSYDAYCSSLEYEEDNKRQLTGTQWFMFSSYYGRYYEYNLMDGDTFSLGISLINVLTRNMPDVSDIINGVFSESSSDNHPDIPEASLKIIRRMVSRTPDDLSAVIEDLGHVYKKEIKSFISHLRPEDRDKLGKYLVDREMTDLKNELL